MMYTDDEIISSIKMSTLWGGGGGGGGARLCSSCWKDRNTWILNNCTCIKSMYRPFGGLSLQRLLEKLQKHTDFEQRRLEEFREELTEGGATALGALLCSAHFLEHSLAEATGPLLLLEGTTTFPL
jgi:hypothetical protein